jgi:hypothetical protein
VDLGRYVYLSCSCTRDDLDLDLHHIKVLIGSFSAKSEVLSQYSEAFHWSLQLISCGFTIQLWRLSTSARLNCTPEKHGLSAGSDRH